ncbi:MAG: helix-turn-helix transcriptional regulator [Oscillospiraceae bacterium]|nr:helix-turn-helix transcriptional regulator [Oscillospiraceae bacterium]
MKTAFYPHDIGKDPLYKTWHAPKWNLFIYFYSDGGSIVTGEKILPIKSGALAFLPAGTYHYTMPDVPERYDRTKLTFSSSVFSKVFDLLGKNPEYKDFFDKSLVYAEIPPEQQSTVDRIFEQLGTSIDCDEKEPLLLSCLLHLVYLLNCYTTESTATAGGFMGRAIKHINEHISSDLDIGNICQAIGISKYYFCRRFKEHTGTSVMKYILQTRIILAKGELEKTTSSITEISERCGFSSTSYFCRAFKQEFGYSPLQYRKKMRTK